MSAIFRGVFVCMTVVVFMSGCGMAAEEKSSTVTPTTPTKNATTKATTQASTTSNATTQASTTSNATTQASTTSNATTQASTTSNATIQTITTETKGTQTETTMLTTELVTETEASTVPPNYGKWTIRDDNNKVCMKIQFGGVFHIDTNTTIDIPSNGIADGSTCSGDTSIFNLVDSADETTFNMSMQFERDGDTYELTSIFYTIIDVSIVPIVYYVGEHEKEYFEAPVGKYYTCETDGKDTFRHDVVLVLTNQKYQPFAQESGGDYGTAFNCGDSLPTERGPRVALIVCLTLLALLVIAVCGFLVYRRKKSSYKRFNNGI